MPPPSAPFTPTRAPRRFKETTAKELGGSDAITNYLANATGAGRASKQARRTWTPHSTSPLPWPLRLASLRWWSRSRPPASRRRPLLAIQCQHTGTRMRCGACFYARGRRGPGVRLRTKLLSVYRRQRQRPRPTSARRTRRQAQAWQAAPELQSEARKALTAVRNCISRDCQVNTPADRVAAAVGTVKQPALSISLNTFQGDICTEADFRSWQSPRPTMACSSGVRNSLLETTRGADSFPPWNEP